jgi:CRP/FNR family transcriptional regulator, cyclic AMP receptor protein
MDQKQAMLSKVPLFAGLRPSDLDELAMNSEEVDVATGRVLANEGEPGEEFFAIVSGRVGIDRGGSHVRDLGPGDYFGEMALLMKGPRTASATALTETRLVVLTRAQFLSLLAIHPAIQEAVLDVCGQRLSKHEPDSVH